MKILGVVQQLHESNTEEHYKDWLEKKIKKITKAKEIGKINML